MPGERTEKASPRRKQKAKDEGDRPRSRDLLQSAGVPLAVGMAQNGGLAIHPKALAPKWSRINPGANLKSIVSAKALVRLGKSLLPVAALIVLAGHKLMNQEAVPVMSFARLPLVFCDSYDLLVDAAWLMLGWAVLDYLVEWRSWEKRMRMSKEEMREEYKESEGNPQMRGRIRSLQRQMRRRKIKADVSRASVVITNPTHYAVALSFDFEAMDAPKVLAKGRDLFAQQIKNEARWAGVPVMENPPLARSLYRSVEPGQSIPFDLYAAVAGILAYLYRKDVEERMRREAAAHRSAAAQKAAATGATLLSTPSGTVSTTSTSQKRQRTKSTVANAAQEQA